MTSNIALADAPGNVRMARSDSGLNKASVANVSQIVTLERTVLTERVHARVHAVAATILKKVDEGLKLVLAL